MHAWKYYLAVPSVFISATVQKLDPPAGPHARFVFVIRHVHTCMYTNTQEMRPNLTDHFSDLTFEGKGTLVLWDFHLILNINFTPNDWGLSH